MHAFGRQHLIVRRVDTEGCQLLQAERRTPFASQHDGEFALLHHSSRPLIEVPDATMPSFGFFVLAAVQRLHHERTGKGMAVSCIG